MAFYFERELTLSGFQALTGFSAGGCLFKAVLFDYDGVLVDSMGYHVQAWQIVFKDFHIDIQPEDVLLTEGARSIELARQVLSEHDIAIPEDKLVEFVDKKQQTYHRITQASFSEDARKLIPKIKKQGTKVGVVSGGARFDIEKLLPHDIRVQVNVIISGDEVRHGKPDPEGYVKAAGALEVSPAECLVIENAPFGIEAAKRAGMKVAAITTTLSRRKLRGADFYARDLQELEKNWNELDTNSKIQSAK